MRRFASAAAILVLALGSGAAMAGGVAGGTADPLDPWFFEFDENGNGTINVNGTGFVPNPGAPMPDPTDPAGGKLVLTYMLPGIVVNGDIRIWEDDSRTQIGDIIRFTDAAGNLGGATADRMIFYSDLGDNDWADTGLPSFIEPNDGGGVVENGFEGGYRDFFWAPGGPNDNVYHGISDVPAPGALALLGISGLALRRRR